MNVRKETEKLFVAEIDNTKSVRLTIGQTTGDVFISEYNPLEPFDQKYWKLVLNLPPDKFQGKWKDLFTAFKNYIKTNYK